MKEIDVQFSFISESQIFPLIEFSDSLPQFRNITVQSEERAERHIILCHKKTPDAGLLCLRSVVDEAIKEVNWFLPIFCASADLVAYNYKCEGYHLDGNLYPLSQIFAEKRDDNGLRGSVVHGKKTIKKIKDLIKHDWDTSIIQRHLDIMTLEDPISRFISLYTLLLDLTKKQREGQKYVDEAITAIDSSVAKISVQRTDGGKPRCETLFTKLRNDISHARQSVSLVETREEILLHLPRFEKIAKRLVIDRAISS